MQTTIKTDKNRQAISKVQDWITERSHNPTYWNYRSDCRTSTEQYEVTGIPNHDRRRSFGCQFYVHKIKGHNSRYTGVLIEYVEYDAEDDVKEAQQSYDELGELRNTVLSQYVTINWREIEQEMGAQVYERAHYNDAHDPSKPLYNEFIWMTFEQYEQMVKECDNEDEVRIFDAYYENSNVRDFYNDICDDRKLRTKPLRDDSPQFFWNRYRFRDAINGSFKSDGFWKTRSISVK